MLEFSFANYNRTRKTKPFECFQKYVWEQLRFVQNLSVQRDDNCAFRGTLNFSQLFPFIECGNFNIFVDISHTGQILIF